MASTTIPSNGALMRSDDGGALGFRPVNITSATTTVVKDAPGFLHTISINTPVASSVIKVYNNTAGSGTLIGTITLPATLLSQGPMYALLDVWCSTGITIVTTGTSDITISYV